MGLMQLMPGTWVELGVRYGLGPDSFDPRDNVFAGTAYLREMHDRFASAGFLAAYHAGPSRYDDITSQQANRFHRTLRPMSLQSQRCSATNTESAPHLAADVQFLGGSLRCLSAAWTYATDYRCAFVMQQRRDFHGGFSTPKRFPAELSLSPLCKDQPQ